MNIARDACSIRTTSSPRVKLLSSLAFNPRFFSPCINNFAIGRHFDIYGRDPARSLNVLSGFSTISI